jgi:hypothetical protein
MVFDSLSIYNFSLSKNMSSLICRKTLQNVSNRMKWYELVSNRFKSPEMDSNFIDSGFTNFGICLNMTLHFCFKWYEIVSNRSKLYEIVSNGIKPFENASNRLKWIQFFPSLIYNFALCLNMTLHFCTKSYQMVRNRTKWYQIF